MNRMQLSRAGSIGVVALAVALESLWWMRPVAAIAPLETAPQVGLDAEGRVRMWRTVVEHDVAGAWRAVITTWDADGNLLGTERLPAGVQLAGARTIDRSLGASGHYVDVDDRLIETRFDDQRWTAKFEDLLDRFHGSWGTKDLEVLVRTRPAIARVWPQPVVVWRFEGGRFQARRLFGGPILATLGPDGLLSGEPAADAARVSSGDAEFVSGQAGAIVLDHGRGTVVIVSRPPPSSRDPVRQADPLPMRVAEVPLRPAGGERARFAGSPNLWFADAHAYVRVGRDLVVLAQDRVLARFPLREDERDVARAWHADVVATVLAPVGAPEPRVRLRTIAADGTVGEPQDVRVPAIGAAAHAAVIAAGLPSVLRPPLLNALSFAGPEVRDWRDFFDRWFRDGVVAGGHGAGWLAASIALGALCGLLARRQAKLRAPQAVAFWTAAVAASGPIGLLWMGLVVPRAHIAACACGRRRAVHVERCPPCSAAWAAPVPTGVEILA